MNTAKRILKLLTEQEGFTKATVALSSPEDYVDVELEVQYYSESGEPNSGYSGGLSIEDIKIDKPFTFLGKEYQAGQEFPKELIQYIDEKFAQDPNMYTRRKAFEQYLIDIITSRK